MKKLRIYVDASVIGGCEDPEFARSDVLPESQAGYGMIEIRTPAEVLHEE